MTEEEIIDILSLMVCAAIRRVDRNGNGILAGGPRGTAIQRDMQAALEALLEQYTLARKP